MLTYNASFAHTHYSYLHQRGYAVFCALATFKAFHINPNNNTL